MTRKSERCAQVQNKGESSEGDGTSFTYICRQLGLKKTYECNTHQNCFTGVYWRQAEGLLFLYVTVLNIFVLFTAYVNQITHRNFRLCDNRFSESQFIPINAYVTNYSAKFPAASCKINARRRASLLIGQYRFSDADETLNSEINLCLNFNFRICCSCKSRFARFV
jgi:hypothetical protein